MYSVPSFGGHIAISRDVTRYPILVIRRTAEGNRGGRSYNGTAVAIT